MVGFIQGQGLQSEYSNRCYRKVHRYGEFRVEFVVQGSRLGMPLISKETESL